MQQTTAAAESAEGAVARARRAGLVSNIGRTPLPRDAGATRRGEFAIEDGRHTMVFGDVSMTLDDASFLPCGKSARPQAVNDHGRRVVEARSVTWVLDGEGARRLVVRFAVDGVVVMARDEAAGCVREADVTQQFLGTALSDTDALFAPSEVDYLDEEATPLATVGAEEGRSDSATAGGLAWELDHDGLHVQRGATPVLRARFASAGLEAWTARAGLVNERWLRLVVDGERETSGDDALLGRRETLVWPLQAGGVGEPVFSRQWLTGEEGAEASDARISMMRRIEARDAAVIVRATRRQGDRPLMLGVGRCPELEGLTDVEWSETEVSWEIVAGGNAQKLGTATRRELATAGCLDEVRKVVGRGARILSDRITAKPVQYEVLSGD